MNVKKKWYPEVGWIELAQSTGRIEYKSGSVCKMAPVTRHEFL
jgi:hypothetical protein